MVVCDGVEFTNTEDFRSGIIDTRGHVETNFQRVHSV